MRFSHGVPSETISDNRRWGQRETDLFQKGEKMDKSSPCCNGIIIRSPGEEFGICSMCLITINPKPETSSK
jgi:hypothetical protein